MARESFLPRDENGLPRRFGSHGEAARWAVRTVADRSRRFLVPGTAGGSAGVGGIRYFSEERAPLELPDPASVAILVVSVLAFLLALGTAAAAVLYLWVALSGGVEGRADQPDR